MTAKTITGAGDRFLIRSEADLRKVIGETHPQIKLKILDRLDEFSTEFIGLSPFLILSTSDAEGNADASPKGDHPGFVRIVDEKTVLIPDRPGNKLAFGHQNILSNPRVGLLFMIPGTPETLRINGRAELTSDPALLEGLAARDKPAVLVIRVHIEEVFFHCAKAFIRSGLWNPEDWQPRHEVSFGNMFRKRLGGDESLARNVDAAIEADIRNNL